MKYIFLFIIAVALGIGFIHCFKNGNSTEYKAIKLVLEQDANTGDEDDSSIERWCETLRNKCNNMKSIDLRKCPSRFQVAYIAHTRAWCQKFEVARKAKSLKEKNNSFATFFESFLRGMTLDFGILKELREEVNALERELNNADRAISSTWHEVLKIAAEYNVDLSKYR